MPANLEFKVEKKVSQEIPEDVTRARSSAWLDLIAPLTEWAGLKGDELRHRRSLLRVQQEESLFRVGLQARKRLEEQGQAPRAIPTKALVPLLEGASLEDPKSELIQLWGNLLASASCSYGPDIITSVSILRELGPDEVRLLNEIVERWHKASAWPNQTQRREQIAEAAFERAAPDLADAFVKRAIGKIGEPALQSAISVLESAFPTVVRRYYYSDAAEKYKEVRTSERIRQLTIDMLEYKNLVRDISFQYNPKVGAVLHASGLDLTELGIVFMQRIWVGSSDG